MNVEVTLNNGTVIKHTIVDFNAETLAEKMNNQVTQYVAIGNTVVQKHMISVIAPVEEAGE